MSSRTIQFYAVPAELEHIGSRLLEKFSVYIWRPIQAREGVSSMEAISKPSAFTTADRIVQFYIGMSAIDLPDRHVQFIPARLGLVQFLTPYIKDRTLFMGELNAKSDWYSPEEELVRAHQQVINLYAQVRRLIAVDLHKGMTATNTSTGGKRYFPNILYSSGTLDFHRHGGILRQRAGGFSVFEPGNTE